VNLTQSTSSAAKDLVLLGGGHSHVAVLKMFGMHPMPGIRLTLVSKDVWTPYSGMLPGYIAGHYTFEEAHIDLRPLCRFAGARFIKGEVVGLDLADQRVSLRERLGIKFDVLSINIGSTPRAANVPGANEYTLPVKPIEKFLAGWQRIKDQAATNRLRIVVVGGGAGGVELALCCQHRLLRDKPEFHLVTEQEVLLASHNRATQQKFARIFRERDIAVHLKQRVVSVDRKKLVCEGGATLPFDAVIWVTDAAAPAWLKEAGLALNGKGFVAVNDSLQSVSHPNVFAAGDVASVQNHPRPKSGVFAVRQGMPLADNLRAAVSNRPLRPFKPQTQFLSIISTGDTYAVASRHWWAIEGAWVWKVKDWIDRRWMCQYQELPAVPASATGASMRCGGCGGKVGGTVLSRALDRVASEQGDNVLLGMNAREDVSAFDVPSGQTLIQSVDFFRTFLDDSFLFGRITTNHCLNDIYAKGAHPHSALATVTIPFGPSEKVEEELTQVLSGAVSELRRHNAVLIGGHSAEGRDLGFGLTVNAFADAKTLLRKSGLQPGQTLILTKALGTGCLFAAEMRGQAKGAWIEAAIQSMLLSGCEAMQCLCRYGATACTDVTGFGLLGHLMEMLTASRASAEISGSGLPLLLGASECIAAGIVSSLHPENLCMRHILNEPHNAPAILFDPQTAGGLLAGVPAETAQACVNELRQLGYSDTATIGSVIEASGSCKVFIKG
jgi:selenide, water dikinase